MSKCQWYERSYDANSVRSQYYEVPYSGKEIHLNKKIYFHGYQGAETVDFCPGNYNYSFDFDLPELLPYSYAASLGNINYKIEAFLDVPWFFNKQIIVPFTVIRQDNLNDYTNLDKPQKATKTESFYRLMLLPNGNCTLTVSIPHTGYAVNSSIPISIHYDNESSVKVEKTKIILRRHLNFISSTPKSKTKPIKEIVAELETEGVYGKATNDIECVLNIPRTLFNSNSRFSKVIQLSYYIEVEGIVDERNTNPRVEMPIIIGSVGIGEESTFMLPTQDCVSPSAPAYGELDDLRKIQVFSDSITEIFFTFSTII